MGKRHGLRGNIGVQMYHGVPPPHPPAPHPPNTPHPHPHPRVFGGVGLVVICRCSDWGVFSAVLRGQWHPNPSPHARLVLKPMEIFILAKNRGRRITCQNTAINNEPQHGTMNFHETFKSCYFDYCNIK